MWNASHVHKQSIKVWQDKMVDPTWNSVRGMLSTSLLGGRFWCSRTIQIVSKVLPDCDISAVKRKIKWTTWRFLGLASSHFWKNWQVRHGDQPWYHKHWIGVFVGTWPIHAPGAPCKHSSKSSRHKTKPSTKQRKFYICADGPHTHKETDTGRTNRHADRHQDTLPPTPTHPHTHTHSEVIVVVATSEIRRGWSSWPKHVAEKWV